MSVSAYSNYSRYLDIFHSIFFITLTLEKTSKRPKNE